MSQEDTSDAARHSQSKRILTLISTNHALSNFYALCFPPLIPFLKNDFDVSYTLLGVMLSLRTIVSGGMQMPVGFLADRYGGKRLLIAGLVLMSVSFGGLGLAPNIWWCMPLMALFGLGTATVRPSNYTIINASIPTSWIGRAFGINMFAGHAGRTIAPPCIIGLSALWGWRTAVIVAAGVGIVISIVIISQWRIVRDDSTGKRTTGPGPGVFQEIRMLASKTAFLFFLFYMLNSFANNGIHAFTVAALAELHGTPLGIGSSALTGYLAASALGVLLGGFIVDKTSRHQLVASGALIITAGLIALLGAVSLPVVLLTLVMTLTGIFQGLLRPARDMLLREVMPKESFGKAVGMVTTGAAIGGTTAPIFFGWILDHGAPEWVFYAVGISLVAVALTVIAPKQKVGAQ
jgi:FSR family fosmidomycin resistance protein-like MFS transporter